MTADAPESDGGNVYDKYATRNPIERRLVGGFLRDLADLADRTGARAGHEIGCGEGELSILLSRRGIRMRGSDVSRSVIEEAGRRAREAGQDISFEAKPIERLDPSSDAAELVVCCEVLEHLPDPHAGLVTVAKLARPWAIVSVPREPLWRALNLARVEYVRDFGNTPGHLNHWSRRAFVHFVEQELEVVDVKSPLPWTMALCRR
jgi:SAM-dependent methyltransferase